MKARAGPPPSVTTKRPSFAKAQWYPMNLDSPTRTPDSSVDITSIWSSERLREFNRQLSPLDAAAFNRQLSPLETGSLSVDDELRKSGVISPSSSRSMSPRSPGIQRKRSGVLKSPTRRLTQQWDADCSDVKVCIRVRKVMSPASTPTNASEACETCVALHEDGKHISVAAGRDGTRREVVYSCNSALGPDASQKDVFEEAAASVCQSVLDGYNGAVIAYGQTGSGKTYTMIGDGTSPGVIPQGVRTLFAGLADVPNAVVVVTVLEVYNERVRDLLAGGHGATHVEIHEIGETDFDCPDAVRRRVQTADEAMLALFEGLRRRETAPTDMNQNSSRSHLVFSVNIETKDGTSGMVVQRNLRFVDLAGSERLKRSQSSKFFDSIDSAHTQIREAGAINKSLSQLAIVIHRLTQPSCSGSLHVPYRSSVLTKLLSNNLGGNSKTAVIIAISPLSQDSDETLCALDFGKRAGLVKNSQALRVYADEAALTEVLKASMMKEIALWKERCEELDAKYLEAESQKKELETQLLQASSSFPSASSVPSMERGCEEGSSGESLQLEGQLIPDAGSTSQCDWQTEREVMKKQLRQIQLELVRTKAVMQDAGKQLQDLVKMAPPVPELTPPPPSGCFSGLLQCILG